jgi:radical SAM protein with 4Fe4S-binding SPASM domain
MSAFDSNLWSVFENDLLEVWNWEYVTKMLNNWFLPKDCQDCKYKDSCRWWSRMDANIYNGSYDAFDPLGDINNKVTV